MRKRDNTGKSENGSDTTNAYYYIKNAQNDVIAIMDAAGTVITQYKYDAWGSILSISGTQASTIGQINPYRYRSYYYDTESGLYYLNSRYYDPQVKRFLNADDSATLNATPTELTDKNLFAYCFNNPVNLTDDSGYWPDWATKLIIGVAVIAAVAAVTVATAGTGTALACIAAGALKGAISGAVIGAATGAAFGAVGHRISTGSWKGAGRSALDGAADGFMWGAISGAITGGMTSGACFVAGTQVLTAGGKAAIETIKAGDMVWSENPETGEKALKSVIQTFVNETDELVHVFANGDEIVATPEHPFYVPQKGWTGSIHLRAGDVLVLNNGTYVTVEKIQHELLENPISVYNFEVEDFHTYFVGENSVLVHNLCTENWSKGNFGSSSRLANYHFGRHGVEVGARTLEQYTAKATNFANQVLQKGIKGRYISGATENTYRYVFNGKYVDMAWNGVEHILVSFGKI